MRKLDKAIRKACALVALMRVMDRATWGYQNDMPDGTPQECHQAFDDFGVLVQQGMPYASDILDALEDQEALRNRIAALEAEIDALKGEQAKAA